MPFTSTGEEPTVLSANTWWLLITIVRLRILAALGLAYCLAILRRDSNLTWMRWFQTSSVPSAIVTTSESTVENKFTKFLKLPRELRDHVWSEFCPEISLEAKDQTQIFQVLISRCSSHCQCSVYHGAHVSAGLFLASQTENLRRALSVHKETRSMAEAAFPDAFEIDANDLAESQGVVRFNRQRDIVLIHQRDFVDLPLRTSATWGQLGRAVSNVALGVTFSRTVKYVSGDWEINMLHTIQQDFQGLLALYVAGNWDQVAEMEEPARMVQEWCGSKYTECWDLINTGKADRHVRYWRSLDHQHELGEQKSSDEYDIDEDDIEEDDIDEQSDEEDRAWRYSSILGILITDYACGARFQFGHVFLNILKPKLRLLMCEGYNAEAEIMQLERIHGTRSLRQRLQRLGLEHLCPTESKEEDSASLVPPLEAAGGGHS